MRGPHAMTTTEAAVALGTFLTGVAAAAWWLRRTFW